MIKINLLPYRAQRKKELIAQEIIVAAVPLLLVLLVIGFLHWSLTSEMAGVEQKIVDVRNAINSSKVKLNEIEKYKKQKATLEKKMEVIETLKKGKQGPVHIIDELASKLPGNLWLTSVKQTAMQLVIKGTALDNISISNYMIGLENSPYFSNVDLEKIQSKNKRSKGIQLKDFSLKCNISFKTEKETKKKT